ncbi:MAG TPA: hypothetical protein VMR33_01395 [Candidatus Baltobacteraceae bacterium]|nr:hypothetical protein [Candidatus Baltobacteraceae bacterium]
MSDPHQDHNLGSDPDYAAPPAKARELVMEVRRPDPAAPRPYDKDFAPAVAVNCKINGVVDSAGGLFIFPR